MSLAVIRAGNLEGGPAHALLPLKLALNTPTSAIATSHRHLANAQTSPTDFDMYTFVYIAVNKTGFCFLSPCCDETFDQQTPFRSE